MLKKASIWIGLAVTGALFMPATTEASQFVYMPRKFPGYQCNRVQGSADYDFAGGVLNPSTTSTLTLECPLSGRFGSTAVAEVTYMDNSASSTVSCTLRCDDSETTGSASVSASGSGDDSTIRTMAPLETGRSSLAYCHLRCTVPPADGSGTSRIMSYWGL